MRDNVSPLSLPLRQHTAQMGRRTYAGWLRAVIAIGLVATGIVLGVRVADKGAVGQHWWLAAFLVVGVVDLIAGAALVSRLGYRRLAWCLVAGGLAAVVVVILATPSSRRAVSADSWARPLASGVLVALVPWELAVRGRRRRFEVVWWTTAALVAATVIGHIAGAQSPGIDVVDVATWLVAASATAATAMLIAAWWTGRHASDDPLAGWLAAGATVMWLAVVPEQLNISSVEFEAGDVVGPLLLLATLPLLVVGVLVRAMRERPGRFQGLAHDVIGWLVLSIAIVAVYTVGVVGLGQLIGGNGPMWMLVATTCVIAVSVEPARRHIRGSVDRLVWGARDDPLEVVRGVINHVGADTDGELLPALVTSLQSELRLDAVAIDINGADGWRRVASVGPATSHARTVDLEQRGELIGRLVVGWEHGPYLRARDERLLDELAGPLGLAVGWVRLAEQLRRSSVDIATTRELERRRLRRDLHDGLGPGLTGVSLGLRTALRQLERQDGDETSSAAPQPTLELLERAADEVDTLVIEVKRIVRDLRPAALEQLGLIDAIGVFARSMGEHLAIHLDLPDRAVELSPEVEMATYRIVTEAVNNVVRHADAKQCWLRVAPGATDQIDIDIVDDGVGVNADTEAGVGWAAMRERATELGGTVQVTPREPHGTRVHVRLPLVLR